VARCPFNPAETCYRDRSECATCDRRIRSGQRLLSEYAPKPLINSLGIKSQTGQFNAQSNINERAAGNQRYQGDSKSLPARAAQRYLTDIILSIPSSELCHECGRPTRVGSQVFFMCPLDGSRRRVSDKCKFIESFEKAYKRKPTAEELRTYVGHIMAIRR